MRVSVASVYAMTSVFLSLFVPGCPPPPFIVQGESGYMIVAQWVYRVKVPTVVVPSVAFVLVVYVVGVSRLPRATCIFL